jgi:membrane protease subunit (stomatin/prohibitin family)
MGLIQFVSNYDDLSSDKGYQFKFYCDKCRNGYLSRFQTSKVGLAGSVLRTAGHLFGGWMGSAGYSSHELQRMVGGPEHDSALREAVEEGKQRFHQCTKCGKWVCPEVCWNPKANLCEDCAPNFDEHVAAAQAQGKADAVRQQLYEKAMKTDYASGVNMDADSYLTAPSPAPQPPSTPVCECGADINPNAKFCGQCGKPAGASKKRFCTQCGHQAEGSVKFCPECGNKLG